MRILFIQFNAGSSVRLHNGILATAREREQARVTEYKCAIASKMSDILRLLSIVCASRISASDERFLRAQVIIQRENVCSSGKSPSIAD